jgi:hypothetical protein
LDYKFTGQSLQGLAYEYYTKNHDRNIMSYCNPQVYDILKTNINSPFFEFYQEKKAKWHMIKTSNTPIS